MVREGLTNIWAEEAQKDEEGNPWKESKKYKYPKVISSS